MKQFRKGYTLTGVYEEGPKTKDGREVVFAFVGAGSVLDKLVLYSKKHHFENIVFIPYQDKEDIIYSLNAGDVHWYVNAKGIKGVSCPSKAYCIMAAGKAIIGVLESGTEVRGLIEECNCGKCCEPRVYVKVANIIRWYIENADSAEVKQMGMNGRKYLEEKLTRDVSVNRYAEEDIRVMGGESKISKPSDYFRRKVTVVSFVMAIFVIYIHANNLKYYGIPVDQHTLVNVIVKLFAEVIGGVTVPFFFMLSGYWLFRFDITDSSAVSVLFKKIKKEG